MYKFVTILLVVILLAVTLPAVFNSQGKVTTTKKVDPSIASKHAEGFAWTYQTVENKDSGEIKTKVFLLTQGKKYDTGLYTGNCNQIDSSRLTDGEVSAVLCWYAGFGDEIGVFKDSTGYTVKHGEVQEGTAEDKGFRGNFKEILSF